MSNISLQREHSNYKNFMNPERLLELDYVQVFHQSRQLVLLKKNLETSIESKQSFLSMHALTFVTQGVQRIETYEGDLIQVKSGEIAVLKKGLYTLTDILSDNKGFEAYLIFFTDAILQEVFKLHDIKTTNHAPVPYFSLTAPPYLEHFWESIVQVHSSLLNTSPTFFDIKAWELFSALLSDDPSGQSSQKLSSLLQKRSRNLQHFMEDNFQKPLSIDDYAYLTGKSPSTFRREFKLKFGTSPLKWLIQKRLTQAAHMLAAGDKSVAEIGEAVGYENSSHFIQAFKKQFGHTPGQNSSFKENRI